MGCSSFGVSQILVGLHRVGVVGLSDALRGARSSGLADREALVDRLVESLAHDNYLPAHLQEPYRVALWREYLRFVGEDFTAFFSPVEASVRGGSEDARARFVELLTSVFADFELRPEVSFSPEEGEGPFPQLLLDGDVVVRGQLPRRAFKQAVSQRISDW